jgi:hypothetical protein
MPAKNTAVNIMILFTALSFLIYRRANRVATVSWVATGNAVQAALFTAGIINIFFLGIYHGYFTNTVYKVAASIPQVLTTLIIIAVSISLDTLMYRGAREVAPLKWGRVPDRGHVTDVFRDNSPDAFTPTLGYAANVVSVGTILFMAMVIFVFWLSQVSTRKSEVVGYWKA